MGGPAGRALLGGFGGSTTSSLEVGGWMAWPANNNNNNNNGSLDFNQSSSLPSWGVGVVGVVSGISAGGLAGGPPPPPDANLTAGQQGGGGGGGVSLQAAIKEKNWPALLILVIIALTVGGNILVILAVSLEKKLQNATNFFLRSLAVADMLVGILVMPISLINILYDYAWPLPSALCPIWIYLDVLFSTASIMHLCAISLDRYVAIRNPIEHSRFNSRTKAMMKIAAVWTISIGVSMPIPVIGLHNKDKVFVNGSCVLNEKHFMLIGSFVAFFIPLVIMVVTYCLTIQVLQRQATVFLYESRKTSSSQQPLHPAATPSRLQPPSSSSTFHLPQISTITPPDPKETHAPPTPPAGRRNTVGCLKGAAEQHGMLLTVSPSNSISVLPEASSQLNSPAAGAGKGGDGNASCHGRRGMMQAIKNERRASKVLGIVFFLFLVMWCPFFITNVTFVLCRGSSCDDGVLGELLNVFVWVGYISSGVNPLVYTLFNKTYRRAFSSYIRCRYNTAAAANSNNAAMLSRTLMVPPASSHSVTTPLLAAGRKGGGGGAGGGGGGGGDVARNSNCRNGSGGKGSGDNGSAGLPLAAAATAAVDPEEEELVVVTDNGMQAGGLGGSEARLWRRRGSESRRGADAGKAAAMSDTDADEEPDTEMMDEQELSVVGRDGSRERTSSV